MSIQIFISYASEDYRYAKRLFESLSSVAEFRPWLDREHLLPGMEWEEEILTAIEASQFVILLLSTRSVSKTGFVQREFRKAIEFLAYRPPGNLFLIPVRLDECQPSHRDLKKLQYVDMFPVWDAGVARIGKAIRTQVDTDLKVSLEKLRVCKYSIHSVEQEWVRDYSDAIIELGPSAAIEACDKVFSVYAEELYALSVLMDTAHKRRTADLAEYAFRIHEIVKLCYHDYEMPEFYGFLLHAASLLSPRVEAALLRNIFDYYIEHSADFYRNAWWADMVLRDVAKYHMATEVSRYASGITMGGEVHFSQAKVDRSVVDRSLAHLTWDIPAMDVVVFYCFRVGDVLPLLDVVETARTGFWKGRSRSERRRRIDVPELRLSDDSRHKGYSDPLKLRTDDMSYADSREDSSRAGILIRAGQYLTYSDNNELRAYGREVRDKALSALDEEYPRLTDKVRSMTHEESREFFSTVERMDHRGLAFFLDDEQDQDAARSFVREGSYFLEKETQRSLPITIRVKAA